MAEKGVLADGTKIEGQFSMLVGAVANPFLKPVELNMLRTAKESRSRRKIYSDQRVFDIETFGKWLDAAISEGITAKAAILAGVLPLDSAAEAERLRNTYTDYSIPDSVIDRLKKAGDEAAQKKEGLNICIETIRKLKKMKGLQRHPYTLRLQRKSVAGSCRSGLSRNRNRICLKNIILKHNLFRP